MDFWVTFNVKTFVFMSTIMSAIISRCYGGHYSGHKNEGFYIEYHPKNPSPKTQFFYNEMVA